MNECVRKKVNFSNKIFPIFYGLSSDLIFFIAINTLFLTEVKGLTAYEINFITTTSVLISLLFYLFSHKIIIKIGNLFSIKLGTFLILISSLLFTFGTSMIFFTIAQILYEVSFIFKSVDTVILNKNLVYEKKENEFVKIKSKATTIYSIATLIASILAGFLFNINPYIPMFLCILICVINFIIAHFIYEIRLVNENDNSKIKLRISKVMLAIILSYGLLYGTISVCQTNDKLFMQYRLQDFLNTDKVAIVVSIILFLSRISRLLSNLFFIKIYDKLKNKILYLINYSLIFSVILFIFGKLIPNPLLGSIMMAIGFIILLALRDPTENVLSNILLKNTLEENKERVMLYFQFARRLVVFIISFLATLILTNYELLHLYLIILFLSLLYLFIVFKLIKIVKNAD